MATAPMTSADAPVAHIGAKPHPLRNVLLGVGLLCAAGLMWMFYGRVAGPEHPAIAELDHFREAMHSRCSDARFAGPTEPTLARLYADSSPLRTTVIERYHALQRGQANCEQVVTSIKSVGYPVQ